MQKSFISTFDNCLWIFYIFISLHILLFYLCNFYNYSDLCTFPYASQFILYLKNSTCSVFSLKSSSSLYITFLYITFFYHHLYSFPKEKLVSLRWHVLISLYDAVDACGWRIDISVHSSSPFIANRRLKLLRHSAERTRRIHISRRAKPVDEFHLVPTSAIPLFLRCSLTHLSHSRLFSKICNSGKWIMK